MILRIALTFGLALSITACGSRSEQGTMENNTIACKLRQDFIDLKAMHTRGEQADFERTIFNAFGSGACKRYLAETDVLIDRRETIGGTQYVCIRVAEETSCYWTLTP